MTQRIAFGAVLAESLSAPVRHRRALLDLATLPLLLSFAIQLLLRMGIDDMPPQEMVRSAEVMLAKLVDIAIPTTMFMVGWQRYLLLGSGGPLRTPGLGWGALETGFLLHLITISGPLLLVLAVLYREGEVDPSMTRAAAGLGLVAILLALRASFGLSARALGLPWSFWLSWRYGAGQTLVIVGATLLVALIGAAATGVTVVLAASLLRLVSDGGPGSFAVLSVVTLLASYAATAALGAAQASIFRQLTGFRPGATSLALPPP